VKVRFTPRAHRSALAMAKWWRANRPSAPDLFERELDNAKQRLARQPEVGPVYETVRGRVMRRVLLPKTERHVYYSVDETTKSVVIYIIWGVRKGRGPAL
jgi:plasmid stabilization system protein ParE